MLAAQAALGLGGVWVNEHRDPAERERVRTLQRAALAASDAGHAVRGRLRIRLAAEAVYSGGLLEHVLAGWPTPAGSATGRRWPRRSR